LFETYSIDFAGPLPKSDAGNIHILIGVEHLSGWPIARAYSASTSEEVMDLIRNEIIEPFGIPKTILSDNAQCFNAVALKKFAAEMGLPGDTFHPTQLRKMGRSKDLWER
jgi:hypothetical protein